MDQRQRRFELHALLESLIPAGKVYFQPPPSLKMQYPCIVYNRDVPKADYADNRMYHNTLRYQVTVIDEDPDSDIPSKVEALPLTSRSRFFVADNLNHDVFNVYF